MTKLSKYFTLEEMLVTSHKNIHNSPSPEDTLRLHKLANTVLDPIREYYGFPIIISSGYRSLELNKFIKGSPTSNHIHGCCADIDQGSRAKNMVLYQCILKLLQVGIIDVDQLIYEGGDNTGPDWIHIGIGYNKPNRNQILRL